MERERKLLICYWTIYSVMFVFKFEVIQLVSDGTRTWTSELHIPFSILYCPHRDPWKEPPRKRSCGTVIITSTMIITTIYWFYFVSHVEQLPGVLRILKGRNHLTCLKRAYSLIEDFVLYKNWPKWVLFSLSVRKKGCSIFRSGYQREEMDLEAKDM